MIRLGNISKDRTTRMLQHGQTGRPGIGEKKKRVQTVSIPFSPLFFVSYTQFPGQTVLNAHQLVSGIVLLTWIFVYGGQVSHCEVGEQIWRDKYLYGINISLTNIETIPSS